MSRITSNEVQGLMEAYNAVYSPQELNEEQIWEEVGYLTEEFILESYQTVADYLVNNGIVPGYNTAEVFMSEMALEDIDSILFETGILDEQYLTEAGFFQNLGAGADRAVSGVARGIQRAGQTVSGAAQRAGTAVAGAGKAAVGAAQRAGQTVAGAAQRTGAAVQRAVTPVAQAVKGTAQRAVSAGQSALGGAAKAVQGAGQAAAGGVQRVGQAVAGGVQRAGSAVAGAAGAAANKIGQEIEISRRVGAGQPRPDRSLDYTKPVPNARSRFGTTTPRGSSVTSTGVSGLSSADRSAYSAGGGNAAAQRGMGQTTAQVIAQGRANLDRMDQGKTAPATSKPTSGGSSRHPVTGLSAGPASTVSSTSTTRSPARTTTSSARQQPPTRSAVTPAAPSGKVVGGIERRIPTSAELKAAQEKRAAQKSVASSFTSPAISGAPKYAPPAFNLKQSYDLYDVIKGHLLDEGYADTEEAAEAIMVSMSEDWKQSILEVSAPPHPVDFFLQ